MHHHYKDITDKIAEAPLWWDENAVPRYCEFSPNETANIYAHEACLLHIDCQACGTAFKVAMTWDHFNTVEYPESSLFGWINNQTIHYGDPPNYGCCAAGPTMNSVPRMVLEYWARERLEWVRKPEYEIVLDPEWAK